MLPAPLVTVAPEHLSEIIRRAERLDEWSDFEGRICLLRSQLNRFIAPLEHLVEGQGAGQRYREKFYEGMVRTNWETLHQEHREFLENFPKDYVHIGTALNKLLKDTVLRYKTQRGFRTRIIARLSRPPARSEGAPVPPHHTRGRAGVATIPRGPDP